MDEIKPLTFSGFFIDEQLVLTVIILPRSRARGVVRLFEKRQ